MQKSGLTESSHSIKITYYAEIDRINRVERFALLDGEEDNDSKAYVFFDEWVTENKGTFREARLIKRVELVSNSILADEYLAFEIRNPSPSKKIKQPRRTKGDKK